MSLLPACVMAMRWRVEDSEGGRTAIRSSGFTRDLSAVLEEKEEEREVQERGERKGGREEGGKEGRREGKGKREEGREDEREREITAKRSMKPNQP